MTCLVLDLMWEEEVSFSVWRASVRGGACDSRLGSHQIVLFPPFQAPSKIILLSVLMVGWDHVTSSRQQVQSGRDTGYI